MYDQIALEYAVMEDIFDIMTKDLSNAESEIYIEPAYEGAFGDFIEKVKAAFIKLIESIKELFKSKPKDPVTKTVGGNKNSSNGNVAEPNSADLAEKYAESVRKDIDYAKANSDTDMTKMTALIRKSAEVESMYRKIASKFMNELSGHVEKAFKELSSLLKYMDLLVNDWGSTAYYKNNTHSKKIDESLATIKGHCEDAYKALNNQASILSTVVDQLKQMIGEVGRNPKYSSLSFTVTISEFGSCNQMKSWNGKQSFLQQLDYTERELKTAVDGFKNHTARYSGLKRQNYDKTDANIKFYDERDKDELKLSQKFQEAYTPFHVVYTGVYKIMKTPVYELTMTYG